MVRNAADCNSARGIALDRGGQGDSLLVLALFP